MLAYRNRDVVDRFHASYSVTRTEATLVFDDVKRYLWMAAKLKPRGDALAEVPPVRIVDEMWHTFLLFTIDYRAWSETMFGYFLDHTPTTELEKPEASRDSMNTPAAPTPINGTRV